MTDSTDVVERAVAQLVDLSREGCITLAGAVLALVQLVEPGFGHVDESGVRPAEVDFGPGALDHRVWATDKEKAEYQREASRHREHCPVCGAFAKSGRPPQMDMNGEYPFTVICTKHGEQWVV